jgi:GAF domain-containing protein
MSVSVDTNPLRMLQLEVTRLKEENRDLRAELAVLHSSIRALSALQDLIQRLSPTTDVLESVLAVVGASDGSLLLVDDDTKEMVFAVVFGQAKDRLTGYRLPHGQGIAGWVATHREPQIVQDVRHDTRFSPLVDETFDFQTRSLAAMPLLDGERVLGVIEALNKIDRPFTEVDHDLLRIVAQIAANVLVRAEAVAGEGPPSKR